MKQVLAVLAVVLTACASPVASGTVSSTTIAVTSVTISKTATVVVVGAGETLSSVVLPLNATNTSVTWSSSNASVAVVDAQGTVTGVAAGTAAITVSGANGKSASTDVTVASTPVSLTSFSLDQSNLSLRIGARPLLTAQYSSGATQQTATWQSSDANVATVTNGFVTPVGQGDAVITATATDATSGTLTATVNVHIADLIINEVVSPGGYAYNGSAVEIYNPLSTAVDLSEYQLKSQSASFNTNTNSATFGGTQTFSLPSLFIQPGAYVVLRSRVVKDNESGGQTVYVDDGASPFSRYPFVDSTGDSVELLKTGETVDFVRWGSNAASPATGAFTGAAAAIAMDDAHVGASWNRGVAHTNTHSGSDWQVWKWATPGGPNDVTSDDDTDLDGIPDSAEVAGGKFAGLDLYAMGARTNQKDIFIHIDYQASTDPGIVPQKAALDKFVAAFAGHGYSVHLDVGTLYGSTLFANHNLDGRSHQVAYSGSVALGQYSGYANAYKYKADSMPAAKSRVFFYMLFADSQQKPAAAGSSGIANLPGNTSMITLGHWGLTNSNQTQTNTLVNFQAATMMHEFGHNLGLHHGGGEDENYKPNYFSVMNYLYQLDGLPTTAATHSNRYYAQYADMFYGGYSSLHENWRPEAHRSSWTDWYTSSSFLFSYSDGSGTAIDENQAVESVGIGRTSSEGIDYSNDGDLLDTVGEDIRYNMNPNYSSPPQRTTLKDYNDWGHISSVFQRTTDGTWNGVGPRVASNTLRALFADAPPTSEACLNPFAPRAPR